MATSGKGITLSPLALLVITLGIPIATQIVHDRVSSSQDQGSLQTQIQLIAQQQERIQNSYITRAELDTLKQSDASKLTRDEFVTFRADLTDRLASIDRDLKAIQEVLRKK